MPRTGDILDGLSAIANQATGVAIAWHMLIATALVAIVSGWRPPPRTARLLIGIPLASVAVVAIAFANPFNGLVFTASVLAMTALAIRGDRRPVWRGSAWTRALGLVMIAFAWVYPHFLEGPPIDYLYAAPVGLVPCPTLAVAIGFALLGNGLGSRAWALTLAAIGLSWPVRRIAPRRVRGHSTRGRCDRASCRRAPVRSDGRPEPEREGGAFRAHGARSLRMASPPLMNDAH